MARDKARAALHGWLPAQSFFDGLAEQVWMGKHTLKLNWVTEQGPDRVAQHGCRRLQSTKDNDACHGQYLFIGELARRGDRREDGAIWLAP